MGREALTHAEVGGVRGEVRALLESGELVLRGAIRRHFPRSALVGVTAHEDRLCFTCAGEEVQLYLGPKTAAAWAKAIAAPPPTLRAKLGLDKGGRALVLGAFDDKALTEAVTGARAQDAATADMIVACIRSSDELRAARDLHKAHERLPLWTIYPKGSGVAFGERDVRAFLRAEGLRDTKSCAVSDRLTATRYTSR